MSTAALDYALFVANGNTQKTHLRPSRRPTIAPCRVERSLRRMNCAADFSAVREPTQEEAFIRPRYSGYVPLQTNGGNGLAGERFAMDAIAEAVLEKLDALYRESRQSESLLVQTN